MEELKQIIIEAVIEGNKRSFELGYMGGTPTINGKDPNELLDINQVCKEFNMGKVKARKVFRDPNLPVQRYSKKHRVTRGAMQEYVKVGHDYLKEGA